MSKHKHLTMEDRQRIMQKLNAECSFRKIAKDLGKSPTTISQEVKKNRTVQCSGTHGWSHNPCRHRRNCPERLLCGKLYCKKMSCAYCKEGCSPRCPSFEREDCPKLEKPPYVCNGCKTRNKCTLVKFFYMPAIAHNRYRETLSVSRQGFSFAPHEMELIDACISPALKRGLSPYSAWTLAKDTVPCSVRTLYRLVSAKALSVDSFDLPYKVRYRPRRKVKRHKIDRDCRKGRTYSDFLQYMEDEGEPAVVEMDTVVGTVGGKVILSLYFRTSCYLLLFLRERNTAQSVIDIFNWLDETLGRELFQKLFPVLLTDNGSEFSNPRAIEFDSHGGQRTRLFYCDPGVPNQKAGVEGAQKHLRRILEKGSSFDHLTQEKLNQVMAHLNGMNRKKLNDISPTDSFSFLFGREVLSLLGIPELPPDRVSLKPCVAD
jgi:IS30 family transposase